MSRLILVPQYPSILRYQEFFYDEFPKQFRNYFDEVYVLGREFVIDHGSIRPDTGLFSNLKLSIDLEFFQIQQYLNMKLDNNDYLLLMDLSYPGFFSNVLYHKQLPIKNNMFCYCHATSLNKGDIFEKVRYSKFQCETSHSKLFNKVFVGSNYHKTKLGWKNIEVVGLPVPPFKTFNEEKIYPVISVARSNSQKITKIIEYNVEKDFCNIQRSNVDNWEDYYKFLSSGKVLLISSKEDTFNYSVMEAIMNKTIVLAPNRCSFPELLSKEYLYNNYEDLKIKLWNCLANKEKPQEKLLNQNLCDNFYENVSNIIKRKEVKK